jgi:hypothetical protein
MACPNLNCIGPITPIFMISCSALVVVGVVVGCVFSVWVHPSVSKAHNITNATNRFMGIE